MTEENTIPEILRRKGEPLDSKIIFSKLIEHEGNASRRQLAKETGYPKETVGKRWKKWDYDERITQYHEHLIQERAESSIKRINKIDEKQINESEQYQELTETIIEYYKQQIDKLLTQLTPRDLIQLLRDIPNMSNTNTNNAHKSQEQLIDSLKYITHDENTNLNITLPELQEILRGNYQLLADTIREQTQQEKQTQQKTEEERCTD